MTGFCRKASPFLVVFGALFVAARASADPVVLEGTVPLTGPDHFFVDVNVPPGIEEIEVRHTLSDTNILDFGLNDPKGIRGWGGGTSAPAILNADAATHGYSPGPIIPGVWRVVIGKAKIVGYPAQYRIEVELRAKATLPKVPRNKYMAPLPNKSGTRYYSGDLHVHSEESTDASATLEDNVALAKSRGLEWLEISDHNTVTQLDFFNPINARGDFLLIPGIEVTTYEGHANAIGATHFVDQKVGQPGVTIDSIADSVHAQGAIFSINHPIIDLGTNCIGCAWRHKLDYSKLGGVEIGSLGIEAGASLYSARALAFWDAILDQGYRVAGLGGSDDHRAGTSTGLFPAKIGSPTTLVRATELSAAAIIAGIAKGATVVKLDSPADPMVELEAGDETAPVAFPGDTISPGSIALHAKVTGGLGRTVRFVKNGVPESAVDVTTDPFVHEVVVTAPRTGEERWRAEVLVDGLPRTVTSHIWLKGGGDASDDDGCSTGARPRSLSSLAIGLLASIALVAARLRRR